MIGATTENPFFSVTPAIRSRVQIFELEPLSNEDVKEAMQEPSKTRREALPLTLHLTSKPWTLLQLLLTETYVPPIILLIWL
ncbi:hypothetical protein ACR31S_04280 [Streptococcus iniae]